MKLSLGERIMILQARNGIDDTDLGRAVYKDIKHPNVKIAKIKNGIYAPSRGEIDRIAIALKTNIKDLLEDDFAVTEYVVLDEKAMKMFPNLEPFIRMINLSVAMGQKEMAEDTIRRMPALLLEKKVVVVEQEPEPVQTKLLEGPVKKSKGKK